MTNTFVCPRCGAESAHPMDVLEGYCGACHDWTGGTHRGAMCHYDKHGERITLRMWCELAARRGEYAAVAKTHLGDVEVSTVWLGIDHSWGFGNSPLIFETMVFGGPLDLELERYPTLEAAQAGHERWVAAVRDKNLLGG